MTRQGIRVKLHDEGKICVFQKEISREAWKGETVTYSEDDCKIVAVVAYTFAPTHREYC